MFGMGIGELLVVLVIVLVVFGAGRLPEVMGSIGQGVQAFKKGLREPPEIDVTPKSPAKDADPAQAKKSETS
ncbi:MAG TPA: twin-arginine translocase TatA/TatE family subunit [Candidatus Limnocylindria bacterium]|jgi:sec-independent protein translocase protein TatA|nr:twin-arginine translocase TatA/TatE family subunit [Candidatus Limnocylindria bacterium]